MFERVPRLFLVLLAIYFLLDIASALASGQALLLVRTAVVAYAAWRALRGSRPASIFLAVLMSLGALMGLYGAYNAFQLAPARAIVQLVLVAFIASVAAYIFFSTKLKLFYAASSQSYWRGKQ